MYQVYHNPKVVTTSTNHAAAVESSSEQPEPPKSPCLFVKAVLLVFSMLIATFGLFFFAFHLHYWAVYSSLMLGEYHSSH
ncbi:hypothetical protein JTE90_027856 [Oedothorax gibbosus]|uniref:Uncharacterized protein n=1 Tax=Oedothorax gibbosus TaxID=931172 RepID=A0AAV6U789_9ARAC|nr:hypothetical protein JTE90_027856 [Oedothorax gibbosus]